MDLTLPTLEIVLPHEGLYDARPKPIAKRAHREKNIVAFSMDSDLEAFSHNPTDGSFGALAVQPTP